MLKLSINKYKNLKRSCVERCVFYCHLQYSYLWTDIKASQKYAQIVIPSDNALISIIYWFIIIKFTLNGCVLGGLSILCSIYSVAGLLYKVPLEAGVLPCYCSACQQGDGGALTQLCIVLALPVDSHVCANLILCWQNKLMNPMAIERIDNMLWRCL